MYVWWCRSTTADVDAVLWVIVRPHSGDYTARTEQPKPLCTMWGRGCEEEEVLYNNILKRYGELFWSKPISQRHLNGIYIYQCYLWLVEGTVGGIIPGRRLKKSKTMMMM